MCHDGARGDVGSSRALSMVTDNHGSSREQGARWQHNVDRKGGREMKERVQERARDAPAFQLARDTIEKKEGEGGSDGNKGA